MRFSMLLVVTFLFINLSSFGQEKKSVWASALRVTSDYYGVTSNPFICGKNCRGFEANLRVFRSVNEHINLSLSAGYLRRQNFQFLTFDIGLESTLINKKFGLVLGTNLGYVFEGIWMRGVATKNGMRISIEPKLVLPLEFSKWQLSIVTMYQLQESKYSLPYHLFGFNSSDPNPEPYETSKILHIVSLGLEIRRLH